MSAFYPTEAYDSIVWIYHHLYKSPTVNIQLSQLFATVKNVAKTQFINLSLYMSKSICWLSWDSWDWINGISRSKNTFMHDFDRYAQMPSLQVVLIDIPTRNAENTYFSTSPKRYVIKLLNFCRSDSKNQSNIIFIFLIMSEVI